MKESPEVQTQEELSRGKKLTEYVSDLVGYASEDETHRAEWWKEKVTAFRRRYTLDFRDNDFPWPGASKIVIPTIDMMLEKTKANYLSVFKQKPVARFEANTPADVEKASNAEMYFEYLMNFRVNDFTRQMHLWADSICTYGIGVVKTIWDHQTVNVTESISRNDLPPKFKGFMVVKDEAEALLAFAQSGGAAAPVTKEVFEANLPAVKQMIAKEFDLDPDEDGESEQINQIVKLLRGNAETIKIKKRNVEHSGPRVIAVPLENIIVPPYTGAIEEAERIVHRLYYTESQIRRMARDYGWNMKAVEQVLAKKPDKRNDTYVQQLNQARDQKDGLNSRFDDDLYELWEMYCWWDIDNNGTDERCVITVDPNSKAVLRAIELPYKHGRWPFVGAAFELNEDRFYSHRGVPEKIKDIDEEISANHRSSINRRTIATAPTFKYRLGSQINPSQWQWTPGQFMPVVTMQDVEPVIVPDMSDVFRGEENYLRSIAEQYIGAPDFGVFSPTGSMGEPRTAREVSAIAASREQSLSLRMSIFVDAVTRLYQQIWALVQERGPREVIFRTTGNELFQGTLEDIQGNFDIAPHVPVGAFDPGMQASLDLARVQILAQLAPIFAHEPRWRLDIGMSVRNWLRRSDPREARQIIVARTPEEQQEMARVQAEQEQLQKEQVQADIAAKLGSASGNMAAAQQAVMSSQPPQPQGIPAGGISAEALLGQMQGGQ